MEWNVEWNMEWTMVVIALNYYNGPCLMDDCAFLTSINFYQHSMHGEGDTS